nr:zinc finger, CCHC-type, retrotransposon Gag domain protein [Tanacetum cinerariifolium]
MGCEDAFKTILVVYKFEGDALAWWKADKQSKGGDVWLITVTWAEFKELFFLQFFPRAEQEHLKREYHSIRQTDTKTSTEFMQRFLRLAGFLGAAVGTAEEQAMNFQWGLRKSTLNHLMCILFTDVAQTGDVVVTTTAATTTTLETTTGVSVIGVTRETGVSNPTDLSILVSSSPRVLLRATPIRSALRVDADTQESVVELLVPA